MGHAYNHGLVSSGKGLALEYIRLVTTDASGTWSVAQDAGAGFVASISRAAAGDYTIQFAKPYPPKIVAAIPQLSVATKTTATLEARVKTAGYDATAGTLSFFVSDSAGTSAVDPASGQELHILMVFRRYTTQ